MSDGKAEDYSYEELHAIDEMLEKFRTCAPKFARVAQAAREVHLSLVLMRLHGEDEAIVEEFRRQLDSGSV